MVFGMTSECKYCKVQVFNNDDDDDDDDVDVFQCNGCQAYAHLSCMDSERPSRLKGDIMFKYRCKSCSYEKQDVFTRMKLNWVQVIHLALYNLTVLASGRQGFFRWKDEICSFIDRHWLSIMGDKSKTSTWSSTVAGALSIHSPKLFKSGQHVFKETGWWALQEVIPPFQDIDIYKNYKSSSALYTSPSETKLENKLDTKYGRGKRQRREKKGDPPSKVKKSDFDFLSKVSKPKTSIGSKDKIIGDKSVMEKIPTLKIKIEREDDNLLSTASVVNTPFDQVKVKSEPVDFDDIWQLKDMDTGDFQGSYGMDFSTTDDLFPFLEDAISSIPNDLEEQMLPESSGKSNLSDETIPVTGKSSTVDGISTAQTPCETPPIGTEDMVPSKRDDEKIVPLTPKEELTFLQKINSCPNVLACDSSVRRLRRKLLLRKQKREMGLEIFSLDKTIRKLRHKNAPGSLKFMFEDKEYNSALDTNSGSMLSSSVSYHHPALRGINILDRFQLIHQTYSFSQTSNSSFIRLIGNTEDDHYNRLITSPYTSRVLKPYIRRDFQTLPPKLKLLQEIRSRGPHKIVKQYPLDYCYVQPNHIPSINALCSEFFWPGIDVTECLQYPEFSCVVLYRRLLVGFAFMVPDVNYNEAYISFILVHPDWQRAGIATNLIYHLIQTCMGKDITLHVSPTNPSMMLYQKFGFKAEALILDFYDKYMSDEYNKCKHAFLLRLQR